MVDFPASYVSLQECIDVKRIIVVGNIQILGIQNLQIAHLSEAYKWINGHTSWTPTSYK